jgi:hypothetical protein
MDSSRFNQCWLELDNNSNAYNVDTMFFNHIFQVRSALHHQCKEKDLTMIQRFLITGYVKYAHIFANDILTECLGSDWINDDCREMIQEILSTEQSQIQLQFYNKCLQRCVKRERIPDDVLFEFTTSKTKSEIAKLTSDLKELNMIELIEFLKTEDGRYVRFYGYDYLMEIKTNQCQATTPDVDPIYEELEHLIDEVL